MAADPMQDGKRFERGGVDMIWINVVLWRGGTEVIPAVQQVD